MDIEIPIAVNALYALVLISRLLSVAFNDKSTDAHFLAKVATQSTRESPRGTGPSQAAGFQRETNKMKTSRRRFKHGISHVSNSARVSCVKHDIYRVLQSQSINRPAKSTSLVNNGRATLHVVHSWGGRGQYHTSTIKMKYVWMHTLAVGELQRLLKWLH